MTPTKNEIIELAREAGFGISQGISAIRINGYADDLLRLAELLRERFGAGGGESVNQWRKAGTSEWWDGFPDHSDGGGPYETRTLYTHPSPTDLQAAYERGLEDAAKVCEQERIVKGGEVFAAKVRALKGKQ